MQPSNLVKQFLPAMRESRLDGQILDLACGGGRNGLYLAKHGQHVVFADRQQGKLDEVAANLSQNILADYWCVDFERPGTDPLSSRLFS
ncbi:MAG: methyltransferase, partial [Halioglobus sp.]|nr:methyltransferase [Halioglobus sp.]